MFAMKRGSQGTILNRTESGENVSAYIPNPLLSNPPIS
jgi:hypothetical protein